MAEASLSLPRKPVTELVPACATALQDFTEPRVPIPDKEEKVDYEVAAKDLHEDESVEDQPQVNFSNPCSSLSVCRP